VTPLHLSVSSVNSVTQASLKRIHLSLAAVLPVGYLSVGIYAQRACVGGRGVVKSNLHHVKQGFAVAVFGNRPRDTKPKVPKAGGRERSAQFGPQENNSLLGVRMQLQAVAAVEMMRTDCS